MMATEIKSKHATVSRPPYQLYMAFVDMRNFVQFLPEDKKKDVTADYDSIKATVQGFPVGVRVSERVPYSRIEFSDDGAPFKFTVVMNFDPAGGDPYKTDFHIEVSADLNFMMKMMLGSRLKDALDKMVDALAAMSEGKMPEGMDPSMFPEGFDPSKFNGFQS
ncbi:MAG: SRPBCC family protein [Bacteroidetes bacterium]|uniref:SRPBCC family protein n=1 Tax=Candidatus Cryptobacteroides faecavium TaxID=2840762 RepID=A0A9D9IDK7_9BACT|nr:SRPBCC family protein [Candidatus Cryptobacteroides faecavium]